MKHISRSRLGILIAVTAVLLVLVFVFILFFMGNAAGMSSEITLPDASVTPPVTQAPELITSGNFVQIDPSNVLQILRSISRTPSYYQTYGISVGTEELRAERSVSLWVNGTYLHAELSDGHSVKSIVTDRQTLYLWYEDDQEPAKIELTGSLTLEEIMGLLTYEYLLSSNPQSITDASYLVLQQSTPIPCVYVCTEEKDGRISKYWIDLSSGLLYLAEVYRDNELVYALRQGSFIALGGEDAAFNDRFLLPDGTRPFRIETETPQP